MYAASRKAALIMARCVARETAGKERCVRVCVVKYARGGGDVYMHCLQRSLGFLRVWSLIYSRFTF